MELDMRILGISGIIWAILSIAMWTFQYRDAFGTPKTIISIIVMLPIIYVIIYIQDNR